MPVWPVASNNSIFVGGLPLIEEFEAASEIYPGDLVEFQNDDANDKRIKAGTNDSNAIIGVADITADNKALRGGKRSSAYAAEDVVKVIKGPINVMLRLAANQDIDRGDMLQPAASGEAKEYQCGTDNACQLVAQSLEDVVTYTAAGWVLVEFKLA